MGQYSVILVISALLLGGMLLFNARASTQDAAEETGDYTVDRIAREAALVALRQVERKLANHPDHWPAYWSAGVAADSFGVPSGTVYTSYEPDGDVEYQAEYGVTIDDVVAGTTPTDPDRVWVTVTSAYDGWNANADSVETTQFILKAVYEQGFTDVGSDPNSRHAIITDDDYDTRGNSCVNGGVHSNGTINSSGNSFDIFGRVTYTADGGGGGFNDGQVTLGVAQSDSIYIPRVVIPPVAARTYTHGANLNLTNANPGTHNIYDSPGWFVDPSTGLPITGVGDDEPYILVVEGNLTVSTTQALVKGVAKIYVTGTVLFDGSDILSPVDTINPDGDASTTTDRLPTGTSSISHCDAHFAAIGNWVNNYLPGGQSQLQIHALGTITIRGNSTVVAHLYTNDEVVFTGGGNKLVIGGITTQQPIDQFGNARVYFTDLGTILDPPSNNQVPTGVRLISYREWADRTTL